MQIPAYFDFGQSLAAAGEVWAGGLADASSLERLSQQRLEALVAYAREHSAFYRRLYGALEPGRCALQALPAVRRSELMAHFDEAVTDREATREALAPFLEDRGAVGAPFLGRYAVWESSGTSGEPGVFLHDGHALAVYDALELLRFRAASPLRFDDRYAMVGAIGGHFAGLATVERLRRHQPWFADRLRVFSVLEPIGALTRALNDYRPTLLATYATAAGLLAEEQAAGRLAISPREIWTGGECLSPSERARVENAFGCRVRNGYGASEFLSIAWDCGRGALHVNADWVLLEPVDERGRAVPPGVASHTVLLTNLANRVQPLIRYDLGDSVTPLETACACGSALPAVRIEGRSDEVLELRDPAGRAVKLLPLALTTVLEEEAAVYRFRLRQSGPERLALEIDPASGEDAPARSRAALARYLGAQGLPQVRLEIDLRAPQAHAVSGKLQRVSR